MNTTIAVSDKTRNQLKEFGNKGETYEQIIVRLITSAKERQLHDLLMNTSNCVTIEQALKRVKR